MAVVIPRNRPWYSPRRLWQNYREFRRYPVVSVFIILVMLILPAALADVWTNVRGTESFHSRIGQLRDAKTPPFWVKARTLTVVGGVNLEDIVVHKAGEKVPNATVTRQGLALDANEKLITGLVDFYSDGDELYIERRVRHGTTSSEGINQIGLPQALVYPGGSESRLVSKTESEVRHVVPNPVTFSGGGVFSRGKEIESGLAIMDEVTFTPVGAAFHGTLAKDAIDVTDADGNSIKPVIGYTVVKEIGMDGTETEIIAANNVVRMIAPDGSMKFILGTDKQGRDILTRIFHGARISLSVSVLAIFFAGVVGTFLGLVAGYWGRLTDAIIMRVVDVKLSIPSILLALVFVAVWGRSYWTVVLVIALVYWAIYARQARGETLGVMNMDYIQRARVAGASHLRIIKNHIFPNILNSLIIVATLQLGTAILFEASLSFLGAGIPPPTPAWGIMVADGRDLIVTNWWIAFFPGLAILIAVLALNLFGDWLRDKLDPKTRQLT